MLNDMTETDGIILLSLSGRLEKSDVEQAMRRLDTALATGGPVHVFAEIRDFHGMPVEAWLSDLSHVRHYVTRLKQFGRVAIVSDQRWIRGATRLESALLPFITYEVYTSDERDHALAWVKGEVGRPRPETLRVSNAGESGLFAFELDGRVTCGGVDALCERLSEAVRSGTGLKVLAVIKRYDGFDPSILIDRKYLELKLSLLRHVRRYAIVGGPDWIAYQVTLWNPLLRMELRHFAANEEAEARAWLLGTDTTT